MVNQGSIHAVQDSIVSLREIQYDDLPLINRWRNDPEVIAWLGNNFLYIAREVDLAWYENYLQNRDKAKRFAIVDNQEGRVIGTTQLTGIHPINRSAEFSIVIGDRACRGKGAGQAATRELLRHGFEDLNLHRIFLTVLTRNQRAIHVYEKTGFVQEGIMRQCLYKQGLFEDLMLMAILKEDYLRRNIEQ